MKSILGRVDWARKLVRTHALSSFTFLFMLERMICSGSTDQDGWEVDARIDRINEGVNRVLCTEKVIWERNVEQVSWCWPCPTSNYH